MGRDSCIGCPAAYKSAVCLQLSKCSEFPPRNRLRICRSRSARLVQVHSGLIDTVSAFDNRSATLSAQPSMISATAHVALRKNTLEASGKRPLWERLYPVGILRATLRVSASTVAKPSSRKWHLTGQQIRSMRTPGIISAQKLGACPYLLQGWMEPELPSDDYLFLLSGWCWLIVFSSLLVALHS